MNILIKNIARLFATAAILASCGREAPLLPKNDPNAINGTEWVSKDKQESIGFFAGGKVIYHSKSGYSGTGMFEYDSRYKEATLNGLTVNHGSFVTVFTKAVIDSEKLWLYWHKLGETQGYYYYLYPVN